MDKEQIKRMIIAGLMAAGLAAGAYFIVAYEPDVQMNEIEDINIYSDLVSTDAMQTTANFITANGTMGSVENDIIQEKMQTNEAVHENSHRRLLALSRVEEAIIPGSPLINGREKDYIATHTNNLNVPYIYSVSNVEVSEPSEPEKLTVFTNDGPVDYESVEVLVSFDSTRIHYTRAHDTTYDGTHTQISNTESFETIVTLVQVGDLWMIYDVEDSEELLNERFATWSGISNSSIDYSLNETTGEFIVEGVETYIEE